MSGTNSSGNTTKKPTAQTQGSFSPPTSAAQNANIYNTGSTANIASVNPYQYDKRLSMFSNTSASVRQKSFDSPCLQYSERNALNALGSQLNVHLANHHQANPAHRNASALNIAHLAPNIIVHNSSSPKNFASNNATNSHAAYNPSDAPLLTDGNTTDNNSLYTAFESNSLARRSSQIKRSSKSLYRSPRVHPLTRRTSILQQNKRGHKHYIDTMASASPRYQRNNPLFHRQKKYKFMVFRRTASKKRARAVKPAYDSRDALFSKMDGIMKNSSIRYDIVPQTILNFGYNINQDSLHSYYGVAAPARQGSIKARQLKLNRAVTTKKKPKFLFNRFKRSKKSQDKASQKLTRDQRKQMIKSQIRKLSSEQISISSRYQNFIDLSKSKPRGSRETPPQSASRFSHTHQKSSRSEREMEKIVDDNSSTYSIQLVTNSKVVKPPSLKDQKKNGKRKGSTRGIRGRHVFLQLLKMNPELRSQIKCTDLDECDSLVLRNPSLEFDTYTANGLNYGFNKRNSHRVSTYNNTVLKNTLKPHMFVGRNENMIVSHEALVHNSSSTSGSSVKDVKSDQHLVPQQFLKKLDPALPQPHEQAPQPPQPGVIAPIHNIPVKVPPKKHSPPTRLLPSAPGSSNIIQQKLLSPNKKAVAYDSPITYEFPRTGANAYMKPNFARGKFSMRDELDSTTSTNFPYHEFVRQSVISASSVGDGNFYTPQVNRNFSPLSKVSDSPVQRSLPQKQPAQVANVSPSQIGGHGSQDDLSQVVQEKSSSNNSSAPEIHNARVRQQRLDLLGSQNGTANPSRRLSNNSGDGSRSKALSSLSGIPAGKNMHLQQFSPVGDHDNRNTPSSIRSSTTNINILGSQFSIDNHSPGIDIIPVGVAKQFDISKKDRKKRKSASFSKNELNDHLKNVQKIERQSLLEHANSMKKRKSKLILGALFSGGKVGLKPNNSKRSSLASAKSRRQSVTSSKSNKPSAAGFGGAGAGAGAVGTAGLAAAADASLGITSTSSYPSNSYGPIHHSGASTVNEQKLQQQQQQRIQSDKDLAEEQKKQFLPLSPLQFDEFIKDKEKLINEIESNSSINAATRRSAIESPVKSGYDSKAILRPDGDVGTSANVIVNPYKKSTGTTATTKSKPQKFNLRVTNISAEEYKRYSDLFEQRKDRVLNPDYMISDDDEAELQRELDSFDPISVQKMIQEKLAIDNSLEYIPPQRPSSLTSGCPSKEQFYSRRQLIDSTKLSSSQAGSQASSCQGSLLASRREAKLAIRPNEDSWLLKPRTAIGSSVALEGSSRLSWNPTVSQQSTLPLPALNLSIPVYSHGLHASSFQQPSTSATSAAAPSAAVYGSKASAGISSSSRDIQNSSDINVSATGSSSQDRLNFFSNDTSVSRSGTRSSAGQSSASCSSSRQSSSSGNTPSQQPYELLGQYMKEIVSRRVGNRLRSPSFGYEQTPIDSNHIPITENPIESVHQNVVGTNAAAQRQQYDSPKPTVTDSSRLSFVTADDEVGGPMQGNISRYHNNSGNNRGNMRNFTLRNYQINQRFATPTNVNDSPSNIASDTLSGILSPPQYRLKPRKNNSPSNGSEGFLLYQRRNSGSSSSSSSKKQAPNLINEHHQYYYNNASNLTSISEAEYRTAYQTPTNQLQDAISRTASSYGSGSEHSHGNLSKRSNESVSIRSVIGNKELKVSLTRNSPSATGSLHSARGTTTVGDLSHSSVNVTWRNVVSPKGSAKTGSLKSKNSFISARSSSSSLLLRPK